MHWMQLSVQRRCDPVVQSGCTKKSTVQLSGVWLNVCKSVGPGSMRVIQTAAYLSGFS
jgi:hypothetical protein